MTEKNNSNKSFTNSFRKKNTPMKAQNKTKVSQNGNAQINFLSTKRHRTPDLNNDDDQYDKKDETIPDYEKFSSKNLSSANPLFNSSKENTLNTFVKAKYTSNSASALSREVKGGMSMGNTPPVNKSQQANDSKINEYFKATNLQNNNIPLTADEKNIKLLKDKINKLSEQNEELHKEILSKNKFILEKDKDNERLKYYMKEYEDSMKSLSIQLKQQENQINLSKNSLIKYLKMLEEMRRNKIKVWLNEQSLRLGKFILQRVSNNTITEGWEDGEEPLKVRARLSQLTAEKEELEKLKRRLAHYKNKEKSNISGDILGDNVELELNEQKELVWFKLNSLSKEENELNDKMNKLDVEKLEYQFEYKRILEEEKCRYGSGRSKERWPVLSNRYLILSLLGKGGYSEVYRVLFVIYS
jgi:hypothetical protein